MIIFFFFRCDSVTLAFPNRWYSPLGITFLTFYLKVHVPRWKTRLLPRRIQSVIGWKKTHSFYAVRDGNAPYCTPGIYWCPQFITDSSGCTYTGGTKRYLYPNVPARSQEAVLEHFNPKRQFACNKKKNFVATILRKLKYVVTWVILLVIW